MNPTHARALASLLLLTPSSAFAGWHAKQVEKAHERENHVEMSYEDGKLRVDQGADKTIIVDFKSGQMTMISHAEKSYISQTPQELAAMKDKMMAQLPPEVRAQAEAAMKGAAGQAIKPVATGKKEKVGKWSCEVFSWKGESGEGDACVAKDVGVSIGKFPEEMKAFADKMRALMPGGGSPFGMFESFQGFPVRSHQKMKFGPKEMESTVELQSIEAAKISADKFTVPAGYTKQEMPDPSQMMKGRGGPPPH